MKRKLPDELLYKYKIADDSKLPDSLHASINSLPSQQAMLNINSFAHKLSFLINKQQTSPLSEDEAADYALYHEYLKIKKQDRSPLAQLIFTLAVNYIHQPRFNRRYKDNLVIDVLSENQQLQKLNTLLAVDHNPPVSALDEYNQERQRQALNDSVLSIKQSILSLNYVTMLTYIALYAGWEPIINTLITSPWLKHVNARAAVMVSNWCLALTHPDEKINRQNIPENTIILQLKHDKSNLNIFFMDQKQTSVNCVQTTLAKTSFKLTEFPSTKDSRLYIPAMQCLFSFNLIAGLCKQSFPADSIPLIHLIAKTNCQLTHALIGINPDLAQLENQHSETPLTLLQETLISQTKLTPDKREITCNLLTPLFTLINTLYDLSLPTPLLTLVLHYSNDLSSKLSIELLEKVLKPQTSTSISSSGQIAFLASNHQPNEKRMKGSVLKQQMDTKTTSTSMFPE